MDKYWAAKEENTQTSGAEASTHYGWLLPNWKNDWWFLHKPVDGAKFRLFCNIIMNIDHDKYGPVDIYELMTIHNENMLKRFDVVLEGSITDSYRKGEHTISKESKTSANVSSPECVENMSKRFNSMWVGSRIANKRSNNNESISRGHASRRAYTAVTTRDSG